MGRLVIFPHPLLETAAELIQGTELRQVERSVPVVFQRKEPAFNFRFPLRGIGLAVAQGGPDPGGEQVHLPVAVGPPIIKTPYLRPPVFRHGGAHDGHQVHEAVIEEEVRAGDEPAGIVNKGDDIDPLFPAVSPLQPGGGRRCCPRTRPH